MAMTVVTNDTSAALRTGASVAYDDMRGFLGAVVRGTTDQDITALALRNESGTVSFHYPNAASNGLLSSTTRP